MFVDFNIWIRAYLLNKMHRHNLFSINSPLNSILDAMYVQFLYKLSIWATDDQILQRRDFLKIGCEKGSKEIKFSKV